MLLHKANLNCIHFFFVILLSIKTKISFWAHLINHSWVNNHSFLKLIKMLWLFQYMKAIIRLHASETFFFVKSLSNTKLVKIYRKINKDISNVNMRTTKTKNKQHAKNVSRLLLTRQQGSKHQATELNIEKRDCKIYTLTKIYMNYWEKSRVPRFFQTKTLTNAWNAEMTRGIIWGVCVCEITVGREHSQLLLRRNTASRLT